MKYKISLTLPVIILSALLVLTACGLKKEVTITGKTMGTTYQVKLVVSSFNDCDDLENQINSRLALINSSMSTWQKTSEISNFNNLKNTDERFPITDDFYNVMKTAEKIYTLTGGAWDGTVKPVINLWGFGKTDKKHSIPDNNEIKALLADIGFDKIKINDDHSLSKKNPEISLNLASIAKGYGVDLIAGVVKEYGIDNYLVEIGGEVAASGFKLDGSKWRVGINSPGKEVPLNQIHAVVNLVDKAIATSGDYRDYFEADGKMFSHIFDPRTGWPIDNGVVSASVIADNCMFADGLATGLMVMGAEKAVQLVNSLENIECLIITKEADGSLENHYSDGFPKEK